jgi:hypothetical protein
MFITSEALVDDRKIAIEAPGDGAGAQHAADIRGNDHHLAVLEALLDIVGKQRRGVEIIDRNIEKPLNLPGMQIHRQHPVGTRLGDQIGHQLGGNRCSRAGFAVLPRIAEIRDHRRHAPGGAAPQRIQRDQQLHQIVIGGVGSGLDDEHILAADVFMDFDENLHIREAADGGAGERQVQRGGDSLGQRAVAVAGNNFHAALSG